MTKPKRKSPKAAAARKAAAAPKPAIVVHGMDEHGKPRAARFPGDQVDLVNKAAALMHLQFCKAASPAVAEIAQKLPAGRIYSLAAASFPTSDVTCTPSCWTPWQGGKSEARPRRPRRHIRCRRTGTGSSSAISSSRSKILSRGTAGGKRLSSKRPETCLR
jgi:hypothetical protein